MQKAGGKAEVSSEEGFLSDRLSSYDQNHQLISRGNQPKLSVWSVLYGVASLGQWTFPPGDL